jgi:hypothetical protein
MRFKAMPEEAWYRETQAHSRTHDWGENQAEVGIWGVAGSRLFEAISENALLSLRRIEFHRWSLLFYVFRIIAAKSRRNVVIWLP